MKGIVQYLLFFYTNHSLALPVYIPHMTLHWLLCSHFHL